MFSGRKITGIPQIRWPVCILEGSVGRPEAQNVLPAVVLIAVFCDIGALGDDMAS
jgi:hypothetical protein